MAEAKGITLRNLHVKFVARTKDFQKKVKAARRSLGKWAKGVKNLVKRVASLGGLLTGVGGVGLAYFLRQEAKAIDASAKLADRVQGTTEGIAALGLAAELGGSSAEKMNDTLEKMQRRLGQASQGLQTQIRALDQLGLSTADFVGLNAEERFALISERMQTLTDSADQVTVAQDLMGRSGASLLNTMRDVANRGLAKVTEEAKRLGIAFSREEAAKVERANDALTRMGFALRGIAQTIVIDMAPVVEELADMFTTKVGGAAQGMKGLVIGAFEEITVALVGFAARVARLRDVIENPKGTLLAGVDAWLTGDRNEVVGRWDAQLTEAEQKVRNFFARLKLAQPTVPGLGGNDDRESPVDKAKIAADAFGKRAGSVVQSTLSQSITQGVFQGFQGADAALRQFGERIVQVVSDALIRTAIGRPTEALFAKAFQGFAGSLSQEREGVNP